MDLLQEMKISKHVLMYPNFPKNNIFSGYRAFRNLERNFVNSNRSIIMRSLDESCKSFLVSKLSIANNDISSVEKLIEALKMRQNSMNTEIISKERKQENYFNANINSKNKRCNLCESDTHEISSCYKLISKNVKPADKYEMLKKKRICYRCLKNDY